MRKFRDGAETLGTTKFKARAQQSNKINNFQSQIAEISYLKNLKKSQSPQPKKSQKKKKEKPLPSATASALAVRTTPTVSATARHFLDGVVEETREGLFDH